MLSKTNDSKLNISRKIGYCDQQPFIQNETILNNILAGGQLDINKLSNVLSMCALHSDVNSFDGGLYLGMSPRIFVIIIKYITGLFFFVEAGESGATISGGQRSRIALARAVYYDADVYLFDEVLSSLDTFCAWHILRQCFWNYLKKEKLSTILMVTNNPEYFPYADEILFFDNGEIVEMGSYEELLNIENGKFKMRNKGNTIYERELEETTIPPPNELKMELLDEKEIRTTRNEERVQGVISLQTVVSYVSTFSCTAKKSCVWGLLMFVSALLVTFIGVMAYFVGQYHVAQLTAKKGYHQLYGNYFNTSYYQNFSMDGNNSTSYGQAAYYDYDEVGWCPYVDSNCSFQMVEIFWDENFENSTVIESGLSRIGSLWVYVFLVFLFFFVYLSVILYFFFLFLNTSRKFFDGAVTSLFKTSQSFFFSGMTGRMLSRLSLDIVRSDYDLIFRLQFLATIFFLICGVFLLISVGTLGIFLPIIIFLTILYFVVYSFFRKSAIELKRNESITRSSVFHQFNETINGLTTIKSFGMQKKFEEEAVKRINVHNSAFFLMQSLKSVIIQYLTFTGIFSVFVICLFSIIFSYYLDVEWIFDILGLGIANIVLTTSIFGVTFYNAVTCEIEVFFFRLNTLFFIF